MEGLIKQRQNNPINGETNNYNNNNNNFVNERRYVYSEVGLKNLSDTKDNIELSARNRIKSKFTSKEDNNSKENNQEEKVSFNNKNLLKQGYETLEPKVNFIIDKNNEKENSSENIDFKNYSSKALFDNKYQQIKNNIIPKKQHIKKSNTYINNNLEEKDQTRKYFNTFYANGKNRNIY